MFSDMALMIISAIHISYIVEMYCDKK